MNYGGVSAARTLPRTVAHLFARECNGRDARPTPRDSCSRAGGRAGVHDLAEFCRSVFFSVITLDAPQRSHLMWMSTCEPSGQSTVVISRWPSPRSGQSCGSPGCSSIRRATAIHASELLESKPEYLERPISKLGRCFRRRSRRCS